MKRRSQLLGSWSGQGFLSVILILLAIARGFGTPSPFEDAVAVWHMGDVHDSAGTDSVLTPSGNISVGYALAGAERQESLRRGGDGQVAQFNGGWLSAGRGAGGELDLTGPAFSLCVRLRDPSGRWDGPLFSRHGGRPRLSYNLFATTLQGEMSLGFELGTDFKPQPLQLSFPTRHLGEEWHDIIVRYSGARLELFVDGVLVDEEWPAGRVRVSESIPCLFGAEMGADNVIRGRSQGWMDHAALWRRALTDAEIAELSGGTKVAERRAREWWGPEDLGVRNFWKPRGEVAVGDCMPFFDGERWHLYYLADRRAHRSKWGLGAHQWAHVSTRNLKKWQAHPMAVPITDPAEGSICTGSVFLHDGVYRAYYAVRTVDGSPAPLGVAVSRDGIHFEKTGWRQVLEAPYAGAPARDPNVFQDPRTGQFHMLVTTSLEGKTGADRGCLAHLTSSDLSRWEQQAPFLVPGLPGEPECAEWWEWNGWYYLVFSNGGIARYRRSRDPLGPWIMPRVAALDGNRCAVIKTAPYRNGRRIGAAFLPRAGGGYAGNVVFRELIQLADGTLATRFVPELMPPTSAPLQLAPPARERQSAESLLVFRCLPRNYRLTATLAVPAGVESFGLGLRSAQVRRQESLRFLPAAGRVEVKDGAVLDEIENLKGEVRIELFVSEDMLDLCLNHSRTLSSRVSLGAGNELTLFSHGAAVEVKQLEVRPLKVRSGRQ